MTKPNAEAPHDEPSSDGQDEARLFYEQLEQAGQLVNVDANTDPSALPAHVTHIRYPDGSVKRIRFTTSLYGPVTAKLCDLALR
jgi:hypothetical protein